MLVSWGKLRGLGFSAGARFEDGRLMHFFYMIIRVYLFVPRWRPVIGRFLVLWHSFNKFVLAKRLHEPAVFNRNHILQDGAGCDVAPQLLRSPNLRYSAVLPSSISVAGFFHFFF